MKSLNRFPARNIGRMTAVATAAGEKQVPPAQTTVEMTELEQAHGCKMLPAWLILW